MTEIKQIESIVKEQGLEFKSLIGSSLQEWNQTVDKQNPNTVYLKEAPPSTFLLHYGRRYDINMNRRISKPGIRNWIKTNNVNSRVCGICYEQQWDSAQCSTCGFAYCPTCCVKIIFDDDKLKYDQRIWTINFEQTVRMVFEMHCAQCKALAGVDIFQLYVSVIHKLNCFTNDQQALLRHLADNDPNFHFRMRQRDELKKKYKKKDEPKTNHKCMNKAKKHKSNGKEQPAQPKTIKQKKKRKKQTGWKRGFLNK
eukprot:881620_1